MRLIFGCAFISLLVLLFIPIIVGLKKRDDSKHERALSEAKLATTM
jgi:hypothetical protein